jgi:hypothetical protein
MQNFSISDVRDDENSFTVKCFVPDHQFLTDHSVMSCDSDKNASASSCHVEFCWIMLPLWDYAKCPHRGCIYAGIMPGIRRRTQGVGVWRVVCRSRDLESPLRIEGSWWYLACRNLRFLPGSGSGSAF